MSSTASSANNATEILAFEDIHADVVLRSSDDVDFPMRKDDLARASPIFADMFSLPQPDAGAEHEHEQENKLPVVALTEPASTLRALLAYCRVGPPPRLDTFDVAVAVLEGGRKYGVTWAQTEACDALMKLAEKEPVRVYCAACRYKLKELAQASARACCHQGRLATLQSGVAELEWITTQQFRRLVLYVEASGKHLEAHIESPDWITSAFPCDVRAFWETSCCPTAMSLEYWAIFTSDYRPRTVRPALWLENYIKKLVVELLQFPSEQRVDLGKAVMVFYESKPCQKCCSAVSAGMPPFIETLKNEVFEVLGEVALEFEL